MRKILLLLAISAFFYSCKNSNEYVVNGTINGIADGKSVTLDKQQESFGYMMPIDTVKIKGGKFQFEGKVAEPGIYQISIEGEKNKSFLILEGGDINIDINKDSIHLNKISGTYNNEQLTEFNAGDMKIQKSVINFQNVNRDKMQQAMKTKDTAIIGQLRKEYKGIREKARAESTVYREKYVQTHPKSLISALLIEGMSGAPDADQKKLQGYFNNLDSDLKKSTVGKRIEKKIKEINAVTIGRKAPEFSAPDVNGKKVSLKESIGRITIIDFWASWCAPCRAENPNMVALYNEFHGKGLNIIGVSLDKTAEDWKAAIAKDQLTWTQVSNVKFWDDPIAAAYGVESIPATFVLNHYGVVVAKDLKGKALRDKIAAMLGEK